MNDARFTSLAAAAALLAMPLAWASFLLGPAAFGWDFDLLFDPARSVAHPGVDSALVRWGWVLDVLGYYFLHLPAVLVVAARTRAVAPLATALSERAALAYMAVGSTGAAILAGTTTHFGRFAAATPEVADIIRELHVTTFAMVVDGIWNILTMGLLATWLLVGGHLLAATSPWLGRAMTGIGLLATLDVVGWVTGVEGVAMAGLYGYLALFPIWGAALGASLLRGDAPAATA